MKNEDGFTDVAVGLLVLAVLIFGLIFGGYGIASFGRNFGRNQRLADERNQTTINDIKIAQTAQLVKVAEQQKQIQIVQAQGIAASQKIINGTLTPAYLQWEAIQAQKAEVSGPNHTIIYVPSGDNGVPLVQTINPQQ